MNFTPDSWGKVAGVVARSGLLDAENLLRSSSSRENQRGSSPVKPSSCFEERAFRQSGVGRPRSARNCRPIRPMGISARLDRASRRTKRSAAQLHPRARAPPPSDGYGVVGRVRRVLLAVVWGAVCRAGSGCEGVFEQACGGRRMAVLPENPRTRPATADARWGGFASP